MTFEIRPATVDDAPAIAEVQRETWAATYTQWVPDVMDGFDLARNTEQWARNAAAERAHLTVAEESGDIIAFASSGPAQGDDGDGAGDGVGQVFAIYVRPSRHSKGIGRALMGDALGWLAGRGYKECVLWVAEPSTASRAFYERLGFTLDEGAVDPWRTITVVRYRRAIP